MKWKRPKHAKSKSSVPKHLKSKTKSNAKLHTQSQLQFHRPHPLVVAPVVVAMIAAAIMVTQSHPAAAIQQSPKPIYVGSRLISKPYSFVAADGANQTTFMPIWYIGKALEAAGYTQSWNGQTKTWTLGSSTKGDFSQVPVGEGAAHIVVNGQLVRNLPMKVERDPGAGKNAQRTVYMPIYYIQEILRAAGISSTWNGQRWTIEDPSQSLTVMGFTTRFGSSETSLNDLKSHPIVNSFSEYSSVITASGEVVGTPSAAESAYAGLVPMGGYITVTNLNANTGNYDASMTHQVLSQPAVTAKLIKNIVNLVSHSKFDGVTIDFELLPSSERIAYAHFLTTLSKQLAASGKQLIVTVPGVDNANNAYDLATIGRVSNEVVMMAYDYSYPGSPAGAIAPVWWVNDVLAYTTKSIPASKMLLGLPFYGYDWHSGTTTALSLPAIDKLITSNAITPNWDAKDEAPYFTYTTKSTSTTAKSTSTTASSSSIHHTVYYENARSMKDKLALAQSYHLRGISIWHMDLENSAVWSTVQQYLQK